jgi:hypothetical protein
VTVRVYPAAYVALVLALYRRDRRLLVAVLVLVAAGPLLTSRPTDDTAWGTRVVLGERVLLARGGRSPLDLLLAACFAPVPFLTARAALRGRRVRTALLTGWMLLGMLLFFGRMARVYDGATEKERAAARADVVRSRPRGRGYSWSCSRFVVSTSGWCA